MRSTSTGLFRHRHVAVAVLALLDASAAWALPGGAQVVSGQVTVGAPAGGKLAIVQGSGRAIVDWRSFGIGSSEAVTLAQPGGGVALFRVTGGEASQILGSLSATGQLFLSNPGGVLFGANARVDVGSLVATTLGTTNADFLAGRYRFAGDSRASVVNEGRIDAAAGGSVVLLGATVANRGTLNAPLGTVALGAGSAATLDVYGNGLLRLELTAGTEGARVDHGGTIAADGGVASVAALGTGAAINIGGVVRAQSLAERDGAIFLTGGPGARLNVGGTLDASAAPGAAHGGRIDISGERITIDPGAALRADAAERGDGGSVSAVATDSMRFAGSISARGGRQGGNGGQAEVSGWRELSVTGKADLSAAAGAFGTLLLDPGSVSIVDGTGANAGPNTFDDAYLAAQLALANVTVATSAGTNNGNQTITVAGNADIGWSQATGLTLRAGRDIVVSAGAVIQNTNAGAAAFNAITLNANQGAASTAGNYVGVQILDGARLETSKGNITINGRGGTTGNFDEGVLLAGAATLRTVSGRLGITGLGGGDAASTESRGISIEGNTRVEATGSGTVSLTGTGGAGTGNAVGIAAVSGAPVMRTASGNLGLTGTGGSGSFAAGIVSQTPWTIDSTTGNITLQGTGGGSAQAIQFFNSANVIGGAGTSGRVTLTGDRMALDTLTASTTGTLILQTLTAGRLVDIGGADSATTLGLSVAGDLAKISAGRLQIGSATSGNLRVLAGYAPAAGTGTLALTSGGAIDVGAAITGGAARVSLDAAGNLRLGAPISSNASNVASTRAISLIVGGVLDNAAGANALATPNGSWKVSLTTPQGSNFGGLLSNNAAVWNLPITSAVIPTGNRYAFAIAPTVFIAAGTVGKPWGDLLPDATTVVAVATSTLADSFGGVFTDYASGTLSGSYLRTSAGFAATAARGAYAMTVTNVTGLSSTLAGYAIAIGSAGTATVVARPITLLPDARMRLYGDANPASGTASVTAGSLVGTDSIASLTLASPASATSNVGSYALGGSNALFGSGSAANYAISYAPNPAGLLVAPRPITLLPDAQSRVYGDANPTSGTASVSTGNLVNGDAVGSVTLATPATLASHVGSHDLDASAALFASGLASNYAIGYATRGGGLTITPRALTLQPDAVARVYGDPNPASGSATVAAGSFANGDSLASVALASAATTASGVGSHDLGATAATFASGQAGDYTIAFATLAGGLTVTPRTLTLTPVAAARAYGDANPASGSATAGAGELVNGDSVASVALTSAATATSPVGSYDLTGSAAVFGTGSAGNYSIGYATAPGALAIGPRGLTLTPLPVARAYGDANPTNAGASAAGLVNGDSVASVALGTAATVVSKVGVYGTTASGAVFGAGLASNYAITYSANASGLTVTPRALTLVPDALSRVYGDPNPATGTATATGNKLVNGDTVASVALSSPSSPASPVGSYDLFASAATFGSGSAANYAISFQPAPGGVTVTPRGLTLTPVGVSRVYGDPNPASTGVAAVGLVNGDTVASVSIATPAGPASNVGSYASTGSNAVFDSGQAGNYTIAYATHPNGITVLPRALTLTPDPASRSYGDANPAGSTASANNLVNGDSIASVAIASPAQTTSGIGSYATTASNAAFASGAATNYTIAYAPNPAGLVVTPRSVGVAAQPGQFKFTGQPDPALGYALTSGSLVGADAFSGSLVRTPGETPGVYAIEQGSLGLGPNYALGFTGAPFAVAAPTAIAAVDRTPVLGAPSAATQALATLIAGLPPTAAGNADAPPNECVREALLDRDAAGTSRIVNRGIRLPQGVVDACRATPAATP